MERRQIRLIPDKERKTRNKEERGKNKFEKSQNKILG